MVEKKEENQILTDKEREALDKQVDNDRRHPYYGNRYEGPVLCKRGRRMRSRMRKVPQK